VWKSMGHCDRTRSQSYRQKLFGNKSQTRVITLFVYNSKFCNLVGPRFESQLHLSFLDNDIVSKLIYSGLFLSQRCFDSKIARVLKRRKLFYSIVSRAEKEINKCWEKNVKKKSLKGFSRIYRVYSEQVFDKKREKNISS